MTRRRDRRRLVSGLIALLTATPMLITVSGTSAAADSSTSFVTSFTKTTLRNDWSGWVGYRFTVGGSDISVGALGRYVVPGNTGTHALKLVDATTGADVAGSAVTISTGGATPDAFAYSSFASPLTLTANATFYLVSQEVAGGDRWYDYPTNVVTTAAAAVSGVAYSAASSPSNWTVAGSGNLAFGPLSFLIGTGPASPPTSTAGTAFVTSFTKSTLRNDWDGWVGYRFTVGPTDLSVTSLGRYVVPGNTGTHALKIVNPSGTDVPGAAVTVPTSGATPDAFAYAALPAAVTLAANTTYYLVSQETAGGDRWYDYWTNAVTTTAARLTGIAYSTSSTPNSFTTAGDGRTAFGPLNFIYGGSGSPAPPSSPSGTSFVTSFTKTTLRNDWAGWVGYRFTVGPTDLSVTSLGRYVVSGNTGAHTVKIVNPTGTDVAGAAVSVPTSEATPDAFAYGTLPAAVTLTANTTYYLLSQETAGGDRWYDYPTNPVTTSAAAITAIAYSSASSPNNFTTAGDGRTAFGLLTFIYGRPEARLTTVATLTQPLAAVPVGDAMYVAQRTGQVVVVRGGAVVGTVLDLSGDVSAGGERGLLGIAVAGTHLYVDYTDVAGDIHVVEYVLSGDTASSPRQLFTQAHSTYDSHNGGNLVFGPDGMLYVGLGDGGGAGDPLGSGQNLGTWLGKILRIDPTPSGGQPYTVPADNPFVGRAGALPEIWAYGLRNPWRFSFDRSTGDLWIGDVGQASWEEIDHAARGVGGQNYGWNLREGMHPYNGGARPADNVDPVYEYDHSGGACAIVGGYVYRGSRIPSLQGAYLFADLCTGTLSAFAGGVTRSLNVGVGTPVSFAQDASGELYVLSLAGGLYRIDPS